MVAQFPHLLRLTHNMQLGLSIVVFIVTLLANYGYHYIPAPEWRVFHALGGLQVLVMTALISHMLFHRWTNKFAITILCATLVIRGVESCMTFVCGSWYAFFYLGPELSGDICTAMNGWEISKPMVFTVITLLVIIIPNLWTQRLRHAK